jgi:hypothetical protein
LDYDPFGLAPIHTTVSATGLATRSAQLSLDPVTLDVLGTTDVHGVVTGSLYDGFGRPTQGTMAVPAGVSGIVSTASYGGFDGLDGVGRRVTVTRYPDPVPPASLSTAAGRSVTTFTDELGRVRRSEVALGTDYANDHLIVGDRTYDEMGRLYFEAEPYAASEAGPNHFGTTYFYQGNGDPSCLVRGSGVQGYSHLTDVSQDRFVTCFDRAFDNHVMTADVLDPVSLEWDDPQLWVRHREVSSAAGWPLERSTIKGSSRLEYATFLHDPLGQTVSMTRYKSPDTAMDPVTWSWRRDSLGHAIRTTQPESASRYFEFDDWGELTDIVWKDGAINHRLSRQFDALGRLTQLDELNNGVPDPVAAKTLLYDVPSALSPLVSPTFVEDRLAGARWAGGKLAFSYDALGHTAAEVIEDTAGGLTVQQMTHHVDGALDTLAFLLPDRNYVPETVRYGYDSAGRMRTVDEQDNSGAASLYRADTIDTWGRVLQAHYGAATTRAAQYAASGRRLLQSVSVQTPSGSRRFDFNAYDALGRETNRQEFVDAAPLSRPVLKWYNDEGELASVARQGSSIGARKFSYDGLGNLTSIRASNPGQDVTLSTRSLDGDRICRWFGCGHPRTDPQRIARSHVF